MVNQKRQTNKNVYVALSGGVDSATAALLLTKKNYSVTGIYMKTWAPDGYPCPWKEEKRDALRICAHLDIPFKMWDFTSSYKKLVVDYMIEEYRAGRTPNPDVMCNKEIKFGLFYDRAMAEDADYIATGHYARVDLTNEIVLKAKDKKKDQSYFLWTLSKKHLKKTLMPIGEFVSKEEVRTYARTYGLPVSEKKDSQGVCFIGPIDVSEFLHQHISEYPGDIVTVSGKVVGKHRGLPFYTQGQREGVGVGGSGPYYVAQKQPKTNTLIVAAPSDESHLFSSQFVLQNVNFISEEPRIGGKLEVSVRYGQVPVSATYKGSGVIETDEPLRAVTEGQSAVMYKGDELIGGGIIYKVL